MCLYVYYHILRAIGSSCFRPSQDLALNSSLSDRILYCNGLLRSVFRAIINRWKSGLLTILLCIIQMEENSRFKDKPEFLRYEWQKKTCHPSQKTQLFLWQLKFLREVPLHRCEIWSWAETACSRKHAVSCHRRCNSTQHYRILYECGCQKLTSSIPDC